MRIAGSNGSPPLGWRLGFTLVELLVMCAIVLLFLFVILPPHRRTGSVAGVGCLSNTRQLTLGWIMYGEDNSDWLPSNLPYAGTLGISSNNWVRGIVDWSANPQNTNQALLFCTQLSPYIKSAAAYRCPADKSVSAAGPRIRSYAMNAFVGNQSIGPTVPGWKQFYKRSDFTNPAVTFVLVDEHPNSIDDGYFVNDPSNTSMWTDLPAAWHKGAAGFSFADGHSEIHRWHRGVTNQPMTPGAAKPFVKGAAGGPGGDLAWILQRTSQREALGRPLGPGSIHG